MTTRPLEPIPNEVRTRGQQGRVQGTIEDNLFKRLEHVGRQTDGTGVAIVHGSSVITYEELIVRAGTFCNDLIAAGVQPRDRVAVNLSNGVSFPIAAFGTWKCGAVLVPLSPQLREAELLGCMQSAAVTAVILSPENFHLSDAIGKKFGDRSPWVCNADELISRGSRAAVRRESATHAANVEVRQAWSAVSQYSTGSMGYPKRVTRSHGDLLSESRSVASVLGVSSSDRILGVAPFFHSHGLMNAALLALLSGATLYPVEQFDARDIARIVEAERISVLPGVPFMFQLLGELKTRLSFSSIRSALSAGSPLSTKTAEKFREAYGVCIRELYGTTETGVVCIAKEGTSGSVGFPVPGVSVRIMDDEDREICRGTEGRIEITSTFAASRYDNSVDSRESYFDRNSFFPGDRGRITSEGELVISGRDRGFVNVGGNKVDPLEVEKVLLELPVVKEVIVVGIPDGDAGEKVKSVLVVSRPTSPAEIRAHCLSRLAEFKCPKVIEFREELPKSPLGKVLRKYLMEEVPTKDSSLGSRPFSFSGTAAAEDLNRFLTLPPLLRVLLATDGTVTRMLAAYFAEPIHVTVVSQEELISDRNYPEINVVPGYSILRRSVKLRGGVSGSVYAFADSVIVTSCLSDVIKHTLIEEGGGIGEVLQQARLETYRELLSVACTQAGVWAKHLCVEHEAGVTMRNYRIFFQGVPFISIQEVFPNSRFDSLSY